MKRSVAYAKINLITIIALIVMLIGLFIFPRRYLVRSMNTINELVDQATEAVYKQDWPAAESAMQEMSDIIKRCGEPLKLFLDHEDIDALHATINGCYRLATVHDDGQFLYELQEIKKKAEYLMSVETFSLFNLF